MLLPMIDRLWKRERVTELRARKKSQRVRLRVEGLEERVVPYSMAIHVFDPVAEPGRDVLVTWRISRDYVMPLDDNGNGAIEDNELTQLDIQLTIPGVNSRDLSNAELLDDSYFIPQGQPNAGDLKGFGTLTIPAHTIANQPLDFWVTADNHETGELGRGLNDVIILPTGTNPYAATTLTTTIGGSGVIQVASATGFPTSGTFNVRCGDELMRVTAGASTTTWTVTRGYGATDVASHPFGSAVFLDHAEAYVREGLGSAANLSSFAGTLSYRGFGNVQDYIEENIGLQELRIADAIPGGNPANIPGAIQTIVADAWQGNAILHQWNASKPTIILVHGIRTTYGQAYEVGARLQALSGGQANFISFYWGYTVWLNGLDRELDNVVDGLLTPWQSRNLQGAVRLHLLIHLLNEAYEQAGAGSQNRVNVVAHSQGTVVTTAALTLKKPAEVARLNQVLFVGANLDRAATEDQREFERVLSRGQLPQITNLHSFRDTTVVITLTEQGAGNQGFNTTNIDPTIRARVTDFNAMAYDNNVFAVQDIPVVHSSEEYRDRPEDFGFGQGQLSEVGWWNWLFVMQGKKSLLTDGVSLAGSNPGFASILHQVFESGITYLTGDDAIIVPGDGYDQSDGFPNPYTNYGFQRPLYDELQGSSNGGNSPRNRRGRRRSNRDGILTVVQGDYFIATAINARDQDPDGYISQFLVYADLNSNGSPDDDELIARDFHPANGWKCAVFTTEVPLGTFTLLGKVVDNDGMESDFELNTFRVIAPGGPPPDLPPSIDANVTAQYSILMHRAGNIDYDPQYYTVGPGRAELWQVTPQNGGNFSIETTGTTDTVIGLYRRSDGQLLAFDEDNGTGANAQLIYNLAADTTYVVAVVSENGSEGNYGFHITGINQTITADIIPPAPLYDGFVDETIDQTYEMDYYKIVAPLTATSLDMILEVSPGLDGYIRVEGADYETIATSFLARVGEDDVISSMPVTGGAIYYVTVASRNGTTGGYRIRGDFGPDDDALPDQLAPPPTDYMPLVLHSWGELAVADQAIDTGGEFVTYFLSVQVSGDYTFETLGNLDTQVGVYINTNPADIIDQDDDSGGGENARLTLPLTANANYYVVVRAEALTTGFFDLLISGPTELAGELVPRGLESRVMTDWEGLSINSRHLLYKFTAPANATEVDLLTEVDPGWPLDAWMRLTDSGGNILRFVDNSGFGGDEAATDVPVSPGETYFITLYGVTDSVGYVRLTIDCDPNYSADSGAEINSINTDYFGGQEFPAVAQNATGHTVVAWASAYEEGYQIKGQRFDGAGAPIGGEFSISEGLYWSTGQVALAVAPNNSFAATWVTGGLVYFRLFDSNANPVTGEVPVTSTTFYTTPRIDMAANGSFVIVYSDAFDVYFRQYDATGNPLSGQTRANNTTTGDHMNPDISVADDGAFLIVWQGNIGGNTDIYGQEFTSGGAATGPEFRVNTTLVGHQQNVRLDAAADHTKVVVWQSENQDGSGFGIVAQHLAADNSLVGAEIPVNTFTTGDQTDPEVALGSQGKFLVIWVSTDESGKGIAAQQFGVGGVSLGPEFFINQTTTDNQDRPALAGNGVDKFFVVWNHAAGGSVGWDVCGVLHTLQEVFEPELNVQDTVGPDEDRFVDFGSLAHGGGLATQFVTITNTGNATLNISNLELYGADATYFTLDDASPFSLVPSASKQLQVTFDPRDYGTFFVGLRFSHNDTADTLGGDFDANPYWVSLLGDVPFPPALTVEINPGSFAENAGANAALVTVTRTNTSDFSSDLVVTLLNSDASEATVPITVTIPATQSSFTFGIDAVNDPDVDGPHVVTITASAAGFTYGFASVTVTDNDSNPPTVAAGADGNIIEGDTFSQFGSFTDTDSTSGWTGTVDYGDGGGEQPLTLFANMTFELSHVYPNGGTFVITVRVTDSAGAQGTDTVTVIVDPPANNPPTVVAGNDGALNEGGTFTQTGSFTDPDNANGWTATVDYGDGGGQQNLTLNGLNFDLNYLYADNGLYTITVRITDSLGAIGTDTLTITVNNVSPTATFDSDSPGTVNLPVTFTFTNQFDPSTIDTAAGFLYSYDFNDDGDYTDPGEFADVPDAAQTFTFVAAGTYTIGGLIKDKNNGLTLYETEVIVNDVAGANGLIVIGYDKGGEPRVRVLDVTTRVELNSFLAYGATFTGGVRVAVGDVTGDGTLDIITAPGPGGSLALGSRNVRVFQLDGTPVAGALGVGITPFGVNFRKGVNIAAADFNDDGNVDIVCAPSTGLAPRIVIISGADGQTVLLDLVNCFPNEAAYRKGIRVAAGDVTGDAVPDIVAHSGSGASSLIRVFDGVTGTPLPGRLGGFNPFDDLTKGNTGVSIAVGDVDGDGRADLIAGSGKKANLVRVFHGTTGQFCQETAADGATFTGGIRVAAADADFDGKADVIIGTAKAKGVRGHCRVLNGLTFAEIDAFFTDLTTTFKGGVHVGAAS